MRTWKGQRGFRRIIWQRRCSTGQGYWICEGAAESQSTTIIERTIEHTYDPLNRLTATEYSTSEAFTYQYAAAGQRILAETTPTETINYPYGHNCLGEFRDDEPLYYLPDAEGYVRQGVNADGAVVSAWLCDPDGTVLEGPNGPVSHLLIYRGGRYFEPNLGYGWR